MLFTASFTTTFMTKVPGLPVNFVTNARKYIMTPIPATIANTLIVRISEIDAYGRWSSEVSRSMMAEALRLREADIAEGEMVVGMIHCMDGNIPAMRKAFKNSIAFAPSEIPPKTNYALALARCGFLGEALAIMQNEEGRRALTKKEYGFLATICLGLGLGAKAKQFQKLSNLTDVDLAEKSWSEIFKPSRVRQEAISIVQQSLITDAAIWQSLANR